MDRRTALPKVWDIDVEKAQRFGGQRFACRRVASDVIPHQLRDQPLEAHHCSFHD